MPDATAYGQLGMIAALVVNGALYEIRERRKASTVRALAAENRANEERKAELAAVVVEETKAAARSVAADTRAVAASAVVIAAKTEEVRHDLLIKTAELVKGTDQVTATLAAHSGDEIMRLMELKDVSKVIHDLVNQRLTDALNKNDVLSVENATLRRELLASQVRCVKLIEDVSRLTQGVAKERRRLPAARKRK